MGFWENFKKDKKLIAAHRGARSLRAENTMAAFAEAIGRADYIELDVGFSKDGVAVIIHDDTLERTSNVKDFAEFKKPYRVVDYTYKELLKLDFSSWFMEDDPFGTIKKGIVKKEQLQALHVERIPTLKEVLIFLKKHNFPVNIEIKDMRNTPFDKVAVEKVIDIVKETGMEDLVLLSSFNHKYLKEAYNLAQNISRAVLQEKSHPKNLLTYLKSLHVKSYNPEFEIISEKLVKELNNAGIFVNVFTVNEKKDKIRLFDFGVKSIFTDILD